MERIVSKDNSKIRDYCKLASSRKHRQERGAFVIEGEKLLEEAIRCRVEIQTLFVSESWMERRTPFWPAELERACCLVAGPAEQRLAQSQSPQGIYAVCSMLDNPVNPDTMKEKGLLLGLWDLQDPGNVGTMIRAADAMGFDGVVLSQGCCDLYNLKTLRAAMGSLFRMPVLKAEMGSFLEQYRGNIVSFAAVVGEAEPLNQVSFPKRSMVVIGNEGNGLSLAQAACCDRRVTIPMPGRAESLNAAMAATILMWEMARQQL